MGCVANGKRNDKEMVVDSKRSKKYRVDKLLVDSRGKK